MKVLVIFVGGHLATAPRAQKEAAAARVAGFRVLVRGVWRDDTLAIEDAEIARDLGIDYKPVVDLRCGDLGTRFLRLKQRLAREAFVRFGWVGPRAFGIGGPEMLREGIRIAPDLTMVHSEAGLWVGAQLLKRGFRVGVDFEDWFSEDLPLSDRNCRPVAAIRLLEHHLLSKANPVFTTTHVMAEAMAADSEWERAPMVIPNCFPWSGAPQRGKGVRDERESGAVSFYWFSQTIGPGRGLETLAHALLPLEGDWELHLRGDLRNYHAWFEANFSQEIRHRVKLHALVPNAELAERSASHDVGLALEEPYCRNKEFTASNKIFEYLRCGLAVVATDTRGQCEVMAACPDAGWVIPSGDIDALAKCLQRIIDKPKCLQSAKAKALDAAASSWAWENHSLRLKEALLACAGSQQISNARNS